jgi:multiple sugar transport system permease protein
MKWRKFLKLTPAYALLGAGAVTFSLPFLWMATTSFKVDRELFTEELEFLPRFPHPREVSPYVDDRYFADVEGANIDAILPGLEGLVRKSGFEFPRDVDRETAVREVARGLYRKLSRRIPRSTWEGPADRAVGAAAEHVTAETVEGMFQAVHRRLSLGKLRVWSQDLEEQVLGEREGRPLSERFENLSPDVVELGDLVEQTLPYTSLNYDFTRGDRIVLTNTSRLTFDVDRLQRIQLYLRPDDTWHELYLTVEMGGERYVAERPLVLANFEWTMATWQWPGPDDNSTKIKTWLLLRPAEGEDASSPVTGERDVKLTLEVRRSGRASAWWNKLSLNYQRVIEHIPFWRYVRVSLFLVMANIVLTVLASSLVAYAFARIAWPGRDILFVVVLATMMIPPQVMMIPHFLIWKNVGAYDTLTPLWLGAAFGNAFFIFLMRQFMKGIPRDLEDAARIDGCGFLRIYWHIILPLVKPSLAAIAIFTFMGTWNNFMGPLIYVSDQRLYPLAFGLYAFSIQVNSNPALTMAGSLLMTVPVIVIFFFAQRYFIQGVTLTGMKG